MKKKFLALSFIATCVSSALVQAQEETDEEKREIEVIEVTVERRVQSIQDYAGVAQSLSSEELKKFGVNSDVRNLANAVSGLNIANQEGNIEVFIRGVGSSNNTELGDPAAATHINGIYIPRPRGIGSMFFDLDRVEVNKGPQGTLRGRNATAGTLDIVTKKPILGEFSGYAELSAGNFDSRGFEGAVNVPVSNESALRFALYSEAHDSYFDNVGQIQDLTPAGVEDKRAGRVSFLWEPSDKTSLTIIGDYVEEGGTGYPGANVFSALQQGVDTDNLNNPRAVLSRGTQGELDQVNQGILAKLVHEYDNFGIEASASYRNVDFNQVNASTIGVEFPGRDGSGDDFDNFSNVIWEQTSDSRVYELRFFSTNEDSRLTWTAGAFAYDEDQQVSFFSFNDISDGTGGNCCFQGTEFTIPVVESSSEALYVDATYELTDKLRITGGFRRTSEDKFRQGIGGNYQFVFGAEGFDCCFSHRLGTPGFQFDGLGRDFSFLNDPNAPIDARELLLSGVTNFGIRDTLGQQLAPGGNGNGICVVPPRARDGLACPEDGFNSFLADNSTVIRQEGSADFDFNDFRIGIAYDYSENSLWYANISTGTKSGGFNDTILLPDGSTTSPTFRPEEVTLFEIGTKNDFYVGETPVRLNASLFQYDYDDQVFSLIQAVAPPATAGQTPPSSLLNVNVANSTIRGAEIETRVLFANNMSLSVNGLFLDTELDEAIVGDIRQGFSPDTIPDVDLSGNSLPLASDVTINATLSQVIDLKYGTLDWSISSQYRSEYFLSIFNQRAFDADGNQVSTELRNRGFDDEVDGFIRFDAGVGINLRDGALRFEAYVNNLTDQTYSSKSVLAPNLNLRFLNLPRTFGVRMRTYF
ncbi:TonB-dependent receptor [Alteromonadaceae bacterium M269]|nr:TonB-dependent receptor [Alteromonadaceae bacterium M269]